MNNHLWSLLGVYCKMEMFLILVWSLLVGLTLGKDMLVIRTNSGSVRGITQRSITNKSVDAWYGIPFAQPPIGDLRFRHPRPIDRWNYTKDTTQQPSSCWQLTDTFFGDFEGATMWNPNTQMSEDCLTLSVIVPRPRKPKRAVMVWIYGGGFYSGTSTLDVYDYKTLAAEQDVILVAPQYRLASLGFLYMGSAEAPGNAGLFDQLMALHWIRDNIEYFGGNKDNITIFGESAGATSVAMHLLSPLSRNLYSQAIMQSGAATVPWGIATKEDIMLRGLQMAQDVDCPHSKDDDMETVINCLRQVNASDLLNNEPTLNVVEFPFIPIIDGSFFDEFPSKSLMTANFKKTNILLGSNTEEGFWFIMYFLGHLLPRQENVTISRYDFKLAVKELLPKYSEIEREAIMHEYTDWSNPDNSDANRDAIDKIIGDNQFTCNVNEMAYYYALAENNVYMYYFTHRSSQNKWPKWVGVLHGDEIAYIFGLPLNPKFNYNPAERELSTKMMRYWANFAKTGNPAEGTDGKWTSAYWPPYTAKGKQYLSLNSNGTTIGRGPRLKQCAFWKKFMPKLRKYTDKMKELDSEHCPGGSAGRTSEMTIFLTCLIYILNSIDRFH